MFALDCRTLTAQKTGDRTYALNLWRALQALTPAEGLLAYTAGPCALLDESRDGVQHVVLPAWPAWTWTPFVFPLDLRRRRVSLAHVQYLTPPFTPCPVVTTIHDVAFRRYPELFPLKHRLLLNALIPRALDWAARVLTGSEATRRDLVEFYGIPPERVVVTPYAADPIFAPQDREAARLAVRNRFGIREPYVLAVGVLQPRKNLPRLVRAYLDIAAKVPQRLVIVGKRGWAGEELARAVAEAPAGRSVIFTGYVPDGDLPALYAGADLFAYPSLYEGFGLPILEAMACGCPVLTGNASSLPEVAGDAAEIVDPTDTEALAAALERLLPDGRRLAVLSEAGLRRAAAFSWRRTAEQTLATYRETLA